MPEYAYVLSTPLVINLNDDNHDLKVNLEDIPDIVFIAKYPPGTANGILRAISGSDGSEIFTVTDPSYICFSRCMPAAGDIDEDGLPEIVAVYGDKLSPVAFEHEFTNKRGIRSVCVDFTIAENTPMNIIYDVVYAEYKKATHDIRKMIANHHVSNSIQKLNDIEREQ